MILRTFAITTALVVNLALSGCTRDNTLTSTPSSTNYRLSKDWSFVQNPDNPYNYIGADHNNVLGWMEENFTGTLTSKTELLQLVTDYFDDSTGYTPDIIAYIDSALDNQTGLMSSAVSSLPPDVAQFISDINGILDDTVNISRNDVGIDTTLIARLADLESLIISTATSDSLKAFPLIYIAVAKHSAAYWTELISDALRDGYGKRSYLSKPLQPLFYFVPGEAEGYRLITKGILGSAVVKADASGAFIAAAGSAAASVEPRSSLIRIVGLGAAASAAHVIKGL